MRVLLLLALVAPAGAASLEARIEKSVARGVEFLLSKFDRKKGWGGAMGTGTYGNQGVAYPYSAGPTALVSLALLKAGVPSDHKVIRRAFSFLRTRHRTPGVAYEISVMIVAVAEYAGAKRSPDYRARERRAQRSTGRFKLPEGSPLKKQHWTWLVDLTRKLLNFQAKNGGWRYYPSDFHSGGIADVSSTQFALLALSTASRCGFDVKREVFERARAFLIASQSAKGRLVPRAIHVPGGEPDAMDQARGFPYIQKSTVLPYRRVSGGMTAAGVASLLLVRQELGSDEELEKAIRDGFAWMGRFFTVKVNPGYAPFLRGSYHFVWLYALERCGDMAKRELIGERSWFAEGADYLMSAQEKSGAIADPTCMNPHDVLGTAFAILFLTRAHRPVSGG